MVKIKIVNETGLHARPVSQIVNIAQGYEGEVNFIKDGIAFNAKSIMTVLGMGLQKGDEVDLEVKGANSDKLEAEIAKIISELVD